MDELKHRRIMAEAFLGALQDYRRYRVVCALGATALTLLVLLAVWGSA